MKVHHKPRCQGCKYAHSTAGIKTKCDLLLDKNDKPAEVLTPTTAFVRYENCAYRLWASGYLNGPDLMELSRQVRKGLVEAFDFPGEFFPI